MHRAIAFYKGSEGLHGFRRANDEAVHPRLAMESLLLCEQLQVSFEARNNVLPSDMEVLKACGKRYRGAWPVLHSHRPGRIPWTIREEEVPEFQILLDRSLEVFERIARGEDLARLLTEDEFFLVDPGGRDSVCRVEELPETRHILQFGLPRDALEDLPRLDRVVEVEISLMIAPIQGEAKDEAPILPFLVVMMDVDSGLVVGHDMLDPREGVDSAMIRLPEKLTQMLETARMVPREIRARHPLVLPLLHAFCQTYRIELVEVEEFDHADRLVEDMGRSLS